MPEWRRPRLWKTLVDAGRTAIDRVAEGVDVLADGAEALARGLRSLSSGRQPTPPTPTADPRLAGVDPALAAYVAARNPVWFSFEVPDIQQGAEPGIPVSPGNEASAAAQDRGREARAARATSEPPTPHRAARRGAPSAAELPGGRPEPVRVLFRRRRHRSDSPPPARPVATPPNRVPAWSPSPPASDAADGSPEVGRPPTAPADQGRDTASAARAFPRVSFRAPMWPRLLSTSARERRGASADIRSAALSSHDTKSPAPSPSVPFETRTGSVAPARGGGSHTPAATRPPSSPHPHEARPPRPLPFPFPAGDIKVAVQPHRRSRAPQVPTAVRTSETTRTTAPPASAPAPWPELPPSGWSPLAGEVMGGLPWASEAQPDVLVDEQRST